MTPHYMVGEYSKISIVVIAIRTESIRNQPIMFAEICQHYLM
ncbi:MAG: hypothetical protein OWQ50_01900 [Acidianus infernus]|nr:hypothetical protein [Acidianus infernus]